MNLNQLLQKKHIFKKRRLYWAHRTYKFRIGTVGLFSLRLQRFELVYLRGFKKLIRRRHMRARIRFKRRKFWFFLKPNCILSGKSSNSRMGAGVGSLVRVSILLSAYKSFVEFKNYSGRWARRLSNACRYRYPIKFISVIK